MTQYWLCILNRQNWKVVQDQRIWGVAERHKSTINRISEKKLKSAIAGQAEAAPGAFRDTRNVFAVGTTVTRHR